MSYTTQTDEELVVLVQKKDEGAFAELMNRYVDKLLRYGHRLIPTEDNIGDIVQDVFITVYRNIYDFDASRQFSPWIYRIAHNAFVDRLRRKASEPMNVFDFDTIMPYVIPGVDPVVAEKEKQEMRVLIDAGLEGLSPAYREIIDLYYFEDFSYKEIADILHIPIGTVGIRLARARKEIKKNLPPHDHE